MPVVHFEWVGRTWQGMGKGCVFGRGSNIRLLEVVLQERISLAGILLRVEKRMHMESDRAKRLFILVRAAMIDILRGVETFGLAEGWITERALPDRKERREAAQEAKLKSGAP